MDYLTLPTHVYLKFAIFGLITIGMILAAHRRKV